MQMEIMILFQTVKWFNRPGICQGLSLRSSLFHKINKYILNFQKYHLIKNHQNNKKSNNKNQQQNHKKSTKIK